MAVAKATAVQLEELKRQSTIVSKQVYALLTQPLDKTGKGPELDTALTALTAAITAVVAAA